MEALPPPERRRRQPPAALPRPRPLWAQSSSIEQAGCAQPSHEGIGAVQSRLKPSDASKPSFPGVCLQVSAWMLWFPHHSFCFVITFKQSLSPAIPTGNRESCLPSWCFSTDMLEAGMEREDSEPLPGEVEEMSGRGEFSEGKRRGNCPLLRRKTHPAFPWKSCLGSEQPGLVPAWVCPGAINPS